jgi:hypothetical protein
MPKKPPTSAPPHASKVKQADRPPEHQLAWENDMLRELVRRYRRAAAAAIGAGEVKAVVGMTMTDPGDLLWWVNLGWAAALLAGGGYLVAPHLRRLLELSDPARPPRR